MTNWIVTQTSRFKAAITHRSISNWISFWGVSDIGPNFMQNEFGVESLWAGFDQLWERSPLKHAQNIETPVLICHSEHDLRCPMEQAEQLYLALNVAGQAGGAAAAPPLQPRPDPHGTAPLRWTVSATSGGSCSSTSRPVSRGPLRQVQPERRLTKQRRRCIAPPSKLIARAALRSLAQRPPGPPFVKSRP